MAAIEILPPSKNVIIFSYKFGHVCFQIYKTCKSRGTGDRTVPVWMDRKKRKAQRRRGAPTRSLFGHVKATETRSCQLTARHMSPNQRRTAGREPAVCCSLLRTTVRGTNGRSLATSLRVGAAGLRDTPRPHVLRSTAHCFLH